MPRIVPNAGGGLVVEGQRGKFGVVQLCKFGVVQDAGDEVARSSNRKYVDELRNSE